MSKRKHPSNKLPALRARLKKEAARKVANSHSSVSNKEVVNGLNNKDHKQNTAIAMNNEPTDSLLQGTGYSYPSRENARTAASLISLGVVPVEKAEALLRKSIELAAQQADQGRIRAFSSCMRIVLACAQLEIDHKKIEIAKEATAIAQHEHKHIHFETPAGGIEVDSRATRLLALLDSVNERSGIKRGLPSPSTNGTTEH